MKIRLSKNNQAMFPKDFRKPMDANEYDWNNFKTWHLLSSASILNVSVKNLWYIWKCAYSTALNKD